MVSLRTDVVTVSERVRLAYHDNPEVLESYLGRINIELRQFLMSLYGRNLAFREPHLHITLFGEDETPR